MAHFAKLDANNVVTEVIVVNNAVVENLPFPESEPLGVAFCQSIFGADTTWKQTSYNNNFRVRYASPGYKFVVTEVDGQMIEEFIPPPVGNEIYLSENANVAVKP